MALLKIVKYGHPVLRQVARIYNPASDIDAQFVDDMIETMQVKDGVGLAATQVGVARRLIVASDTRELYVVINPVISARSIKTEIEVEGCLSLPGLQGRVERHQKIIVAGLDRYGRPLEIKTAGLMARVMQHEIDHLNGVLFIDRAEHGSLNWVQYVQDDAGNEKTELTPTNIAEIQAVFRKTYNQDLAELLFIRTESSGSERKQLAIF